MIKVEAIVRPERISVVTNALSQVGVGGFYYQNLTGQGRQGGTEVFTGRGAIMAKAAVSKTIIVTVVPDGMKEKVVDAIIDAAKGPDGGQIGDGKIMITEVADVIRVRTGDRGESAL